jgi:hypothetical protein
MPTPDTRARRYTSADKAEALKLKHGGWNTAEITRLMQAAGIPVTYTAVRLWVDPEFAERHRAHNRAAKRRKLAETATFSWPGRATPDWKLRRMEVLRRAGVSVSAIKKIMHIDFPNDPPLTEHQIRYAIEQREVPRVLREPA